MAYGAWQFRRRRRRAASVLGVDPVGLAGQPLDDIADTVLRKQADLIDTDLRLKTLQIARERAQIAGERASFALRILTLLAILGAVAIFAAMAWTASRASGLVIVSISTPADLAARGLTGEVVAAQFQDELTRLSDAARISEPGGAIRGQPDETISLDIPSTGISISELDRLLRRWLGKEIYLTGEVFNTPEGLRLVARAPSGLRSSVGPEQTLDVVIAKTAESVLEKTQPSRYGFYLMQAQRADEAGAVFNRVIEQGPASERPRAYLGRGILAARSDTPRAMADWRAGLSLDPGLQAAIGNLARFELEFGHLQAAHDYERQRLAAFQKTGREIDERPRRILLAQARIAFLSGDYQSALDAYEDAEKRFPGQHNNEWYIARVEALTMLHRSSDAQAFLQQHADRIGADYTPPLNLLRAGEDANWPAVVAAEQGLVARLEAAAAAGSAAAARLLKQGPAGRQLILAYALARSGQLAEARALIDATPLDCQPCVQVRAMISAVEGNADETGRWFAEAVRLAPSLPFAHLSWGEALLAKGQTDAAIEQFRLANSKSPSFADPLHRWGEALMSKGQYRDALEKLKAAQKHATGWGRNHMLMGNAQDRLERRDQALEAWRAAAGLDLSAADKAAVQQLLAGQSENSAALR